MYNLSLPMLMCYVLKPYALRLPTGGCYPAECWHSNGLGLTAVFLSYSVSPLHTVLCDDLYTACVDASRTVFWDRSKLRLRAVIILFMEVLSRNFNEITHHWNRSPASDHGILAMIALRQNYLIVMYMQKNELSCITTVSNLWNRIVHKKS